MSGIDEEDEMGDLSTDSSVQCPYCGEIVDIALDPSGGKVQQYVEDCAVCCQPWNVAVRFETDGTADVTVSAQDE